jgi:hypothetical protein
MPVEISDPWKRRDIVQVVGFENGTGCIVERNIVRIIEFQNGSYAFQQSRLECVDAGRINASLAGRVN